MLGLMDYLSSLLPGPTAPPGGYAPTENVFGGARPLGLGLPIPEGPPRGGQGGNTNAPSVRTTPSPNSPIMNSGIAPAPPVPAGAVGRLKGVGMPALAPPVATPIARDATGDATAVAAAAVPQGPGRQISPGPNVIAPLAELPPVAAAVPAPTPVASARSHLADIISQQHDPRILSALMGGLPRQPMPQEIAQQKMMQMHDQVFNDEMANALKMTDPNAQAIAKSNAYEKYIKSMRVIATPGYGMIGYGQEDKAD